MPAADLHWLFIDLNSYFASVEQDAVPALRGKPIGIVPVDAETTCCIAASYQARAYGIRTGHSVADARALCPHLELVRARPRLYVEYHQRIVAAIERCLPIQQVLSCDEFACQLIGQERLLPRATEIAYRIKQEIRAVGDTLRCSIGIAPNRFLAKVAGEMQKPDGLMVLERATLPAALFGLELSDLPGIGSRMRRRLQAADVTTVRELCRLPRERMHALWGGVLGDRLFLLLKGEDLPPPVPGPVQSLSRQHVLAPHCRTPEAARAVSIKLLLSTARRMRQQQLWASGVALQVAYLGTDHRFEGAMRCEPTQSLLVLQSVLTEMWKHAPQHGHLPRFVSVVLAPLGPEPERGLFDAPAHAPLTAVVDALNARFGLNTVYPASIHAVRREAPTRIPFGPPLPLDDFTDPADTIPPAHP